MATNSQDTKGNKTGSKGKVVLAYSGGLGLVKLAGLDSDEPIFDMVDSADAVLATQLVEGFEEGDAIDGLAVECGRSAPFEIDDDFSGFVRGFGEPRSLLSKLLPPACVSLNMRAGTQSSVLRELAALAEQSWQVWDPVALLDSLREREERGSTAQTGGIAIPHPTRRLKAELGESVLAFARLASPIQFGSPDNQPTDLFFMVACRDDATHLQVLTRIARLIRLDGFLDTIRSFDSPLDFCHYMQEAEASLPPALGA